MVLEQRVGSLNVLKAWRDETRSARGLVWSRSRWNPVSGDTEIVHRMGSVGRAENDHELTVTLVRPQSDAPSYVLMIGTRWGIGEVEALIDLLNRVVALAGCPVNVAEQTPTRTREPPMS